MWLVFMAFLQFQNPSNSQTWQDDRQAYSEVVTTSRSREKHLWLYLRLYNPDNTQT